MGGEMPSLPTDRARSASVMDISPPEQTGLSTTRSGQFAYVHPSVPQWVETYASSESTHKVKSEVKVKVAELCPTLCDPMGSTVHGILQARILEWAPHAR